MNSITSPPYAFVYSLVLRNASGRATPYSANQPHRSVRDRTRSRRFMPCVCRRLYVSYVSYLIDSPFSSIKLISALHSTTSFCTSLISAHFRTYVGAHKSSWAAHIKYFPRDASNTRLKLAAAPKLVEFLRNVTRRSFLTNRRQMSSVPSVEALS